MTQVIDLLRAYNRVKEVKGDIGVEIEVEGSNICTMEKWWKNERDGSLQGESLEYVLARPCTLDEVSQALRYMDETWTKNKTVINEALRAGVHVHINCQRLSVKQLYSFMSAFFIFENVLVKFSGPKREGNLFCLRSKDAEYLLDVITDAVSDHKRLLNFFHTDMLRYAAMNVKALGDYGSIEFRTMRSTRDLSVIYNWVQMLYNLREYACKFDRPSDLIEKFSMDGPLDMMKEAFGEQYDVLLKMYSSQVELERDLHEGMRNAQQVAYSVEDWDAFDNYVAKLVNGVAVDPNNENEPEADF